MTQTEEKERWKRLVEDLQSAGVSVAQIAAHLKVEPRQVWRWKEGDRPGGLTAVMLDRLHTKECAGMFHVKTCPELPDD